MDDFSVGGEITHEGRVFRLRGISPMGATVRRVILEDVDTHDSIEVELDAVAEPDQRRAEAPDRS